MEWIVILSGLGLLFLVLRSKGKKRRPSTPHLSRPAVSYVTDDDHDELFINPSTSAECWLPAGRKTKIGPHRISGGMLYVGKTLLNIQGYGVEPALIDPTLKRSDRRPDHQGQGMSYWPSYSHIPPACRSGYLHWLSGERSEPTTYIGYVFLFLYGLERRALYDAKSLSDATAEIPAIADEVQRLLSIYGNNNSFRRYASSFLDLLRITTQAADLRRPPEPGQSKNRELPFVLRIAIAKMSIQNKPIPADWALAWVRSDPEIPLRTPARRCPDEFDILFRRHYETRHRNGLEIKPCKRLLHIKYRPASPSFGQEIHIPTDLPDVTSLVAPRRKLIQIASECDDELASFSRWVGKYPEGRNQLAAAAVLPEALLEDHAPSAFHKLKADLEEKLGTRSLTTLPAASVLDPWLPPLGEKQTKKKAVESARLLAQAGFGIEPDARFGGRRIERGDRLVVFRLVSDEHETPTASYSAATTLLHLATVVSAADGEVSREEEEKLGQHVAEGLHLNASERRRLEAHLQMLLAQPPGFAGIKKRLEDLSPLQREGAGRFLVQIAWADGIVEPEEVKSLTKIFRLLELDPGKVHQWLHETQTESIKSDPVTVRPSAQSTGYAIPAPPAEPKEVPEEPRPTASSSKATPSALNKEAIRAKLDETAAVSAMLSGIFADEADEPSQQSQPELQSEECIAGLDAFHSALLRKLGRKTVWEWEEYADLAESLGLMASGALDQLNEAAFEVCDQPLTDGEDPIAIDTAVYQEVVT